MNGLQMSDGSTLRCSFGTSKYCANFLAYGECEAHEAKRSCPFIHSLERRRDKVIEDDNEFKDYLAVQATIASDFCFELGLRAQQQINIWSFQSGLPGPVHVFGASLKELMDKVPASRLASIPKIRFLRLRSFQLQRWQPLYSDDSCQVQPRSVSLPALRAAYGRENDQYYAEKTESRFMTVSVKGDETVQ